ncbi:unnamed protein product [Linum trigynum]|uniref:Uncharacterized protein n=1 Tax=Linum trigynum TaxID=586398 RepID=A0AAV2C772_9ROSI
MGNGDGSGGQPEYYDYKGERIQTPPGQPEYYTYNYGDSEMIHSRPKRSPERPKVQAADMNKTKEKATDGTRGRR